MAGDIQQFFRDHSISEVEAIIPDMAGIARGKIMPAEKFAEDEGMRLRHEGRVHLVPQRGLARGALEQERLFGQI